MFGFGIEGALNLLGPAGPFLKKYWREAVIAALAASVALCIMHGREITKTLTVEKAETASLTTSLVETRSELAMRESQVTQAESRTQTLEQQLHMAQTTSKISTPVLIGGQVAFETREQSGTITDSSSQEKAITELKVQAITQERDQALLSRDSKAAQLIESQEKIKQLETSKPGMRHWLATWGNAVGGPASGTWLGGLGYQLEAGGYNLGILIQYPVIGGPEGGPGRRAMEDRPVVGGFTFNF